jgi:hypothetical protein
MAIRKGAQKDQSNAHAPGKRHRNPGLQEAIDKRMGEPTGKQMGQKSVKAGWRVGRG